VSKIALESPVQMDVVEDLKGSTAEMDSIASFSEEDDRPTASVHVNEVLPDVMASQTPQRSQRQPQVVSTCSKKTKTKPNKVEPKRKACICGDATTDLTMVGCEHCGRWYHMPCSGCV
jgi:hypothetical protein